MSQKELTPAQKLFCERYVVHGITYKAVREAGLCLNNPASARAMGTEMKKLPYVKEYIKQLRKEAKKASLTDATTLRRVLTRLIERHADDPVAVTKAVDLLNKMNGHYEKDNMQKAGKIVMEMNFDGK